MRALFQSISEQINFAISRRTALNDKVTRLLLHMSDLFESKRACVADLDVCIHCIEEIVEPAKASSCDESLGAKIVRERSFGLLPLGFACVRFAAGVLVGCEATAGGIGNERYL